MTSAYSDQGIHIVPKYEHSDKISFRRKALFPVDSEDSNSGLGPMSPLSDTNSDFQTFKNCFRSTRIDDYVMLDESADLDYEDLDISTYSTTICETPSSIDLNLTYSDSKSPFCYNRLKDKSPSKTLLTPHDTSTTNTQLPRLSRKSQSEDSGEEYKSETKIPKARTALFTEVLALPAKSFYPKTQEKRPQRVFKMKENEAQKNKNKSANLYLCNRRKRNILGQINAGVRHNIKKPRLRSTKMSSKNIPMSTLEGSQLVEYMKDIKDLTKNISKQIKPLEKHDLQKQENTENCDVVNKADNKFFKSTAPKKIIFEKENVILKVDDEKRFDVSQIIDDFDDDPNTDIDKIISTLDADLETNQIVLTVSAKVNDSENSVMLHSTANNNGQPLNNKENEIYNIRKRKHEETATSIADIILSPTSQMCDMASEMAINSPKRAKLNINNILENNKCLETRVSNVFNKISSSSAMEDMKLFPIFYAQNNFNNKDRCNVPKITVSKRWNKISRDQMILDAGQKRFGLTQCPTCELVYDMGNPLEEEKHKEYHSGTHILKFRGWKNERIVSTYGNDRVVKIMPGDSKIWMKKVRDLMLIVNKELGFYESQLTLENCAVYLYIKNKNIAGCVVAEPKTSANKMLSTVEDIDLCSEESYMIKCAIQRIWVVDGFRRCGIATALMDSVRKNFCYGYILRLEDIAVSAPTELGKIFAVTYFKTNNYLVCTM